MNFATRRRRNSNANVEATSRPSAASPTLRAATPAAFLSSSPSVESEAQFRATWEASAYAGNIEDATVVKLHREKLQVSYLEYPEFDRDPHPALRGNTVVRLADLDISRRNYSAYKNPFILHRKEEFVLEDDPRHTKFARLTAQEERRGLYDAPSAIGTRDGWEQILRERGVTLRGHRVVNV